jgi:hypothetical protein
MISGRLTRHLLPIALLAAVAVPCALGGAALDDGAPRSKVVVAGAARDTLPYQWEDVLPVAIGQLELNDWAIQRAESLVVSGGQSGERLVTRWKPLKHMLARAFFGDLRARCVVDLVPAGAGTIVTIQGGLTSAEDLEANPGFPLARTTYRRAAEKWLVGVKNELASRERRGLVSRR